MEKEKFNYQWILQQQDDKIILANQFGITIVLNKNYEFEFGNIVNDIKFNDIIEDAVQFAKNYVFQLMFEAEFKRRTDLISNRDFVTMCIRFCESVGITPAEWKENKAHLLMFMANEFCSIENSINETFDIYRKQQ